MQNRSHAAAAFRKYARYGFDRRHLRPLDMYECIKGSTPSAESAGEMLAVYDTLRLLRFYGKEETVRAVRAVYFTYPGCRLKKNDLSLRVRRFAMENYCDERTVYRRLSEALRLWWALMEDQ